MIIILVIRLSGFNFTRLMALNMSLWLIQHEIAGCRTAQMSYT